MGLDVSVVMGIGKRIRAKVSEEDDDYDTRVHLYVAAPEWEARLAPFKPGVYTCEARYEHGFRAGSYSGYNAFRMQLCRTAHKVGPEAIWADTSGVYDGKPFVELINFSDCEGFIGPDVSRKLAADFKTHRETFASALDEARAWMLERYDLWAKAFEVAAQTNGAVQLH